MTETLETSAKPAATAPAHMTASSTPSGAGLAQQVVVNGRHTILTDEPERLGGLDAGPTPHELLPAALASCVATMVAMYARNRGWEIGEPSVRVDYDPASTPRRAVVELQLPPGLSPDQRARLERVASTCPLRRALEAGFEFEERTTETLAA
ncbi:MAG TPA: OsmC family protein [Solirubrobacteraceae bacterium]|nr:OsmC family protein [Solirubrobacteraceae bacterium]